MRQLLRSTVVNGVLMLGLVSASHAGTITFDFDTGSPSQTSTPFTYTLSGLTATFNAAGDPGSYSILNLSGFVTLSNNVLFSNPSGNAEDLTISFDSPLSSISLNFATADSNPVTLTAMLGGNPLPNPDSESGSGSPVEGVLGYSNTPFDSVLIQPTAGESNLAIDNITVTTAASSAPEPGSFLLGGGALAILSLAMRRRRKA